MNCNRCAHYSTLNRITSPVGFCAAREVIACADIDGSNCVDFKPLGVASCALKNDFFSALSEAEKNHQRRSSTADESGLPDFSSKAEVA